MKEYNRIFIVFLIILIYPILSQNKSDQNTETNYVELAINIFKKLEEECFVELEGLFHERIKFEKDKRYPWLMDSIGKGINDIGDEIECLYSLQNTTFFLVNFYQLDLSKILDNDQHLINFLDIKNFTLGFCLMYKCRDAFRRYLKLIAEFVNFVATNETADDNLVRYIEDSRINGSESWNAYNTEALDTYSWKKAIGFIIGIFSAIKLLGGIIRTFVLPKGYDKYIAEKLNKSNKNEENMNNDFDIEEKTNLSNKNKFNEALNEERNTKDYNPLFDFSEKLPIKIRILRIFDLFNDLHYLTSKRNRYYNDLGLEIIVFLRALMIMGVVFSNTFSAQVALPSEEIINSSFFKSDFNILYRISNNSFTAWIFLEGAYTTYKLLCFVTSEMFFYYAKNEKHSLNLKLLIVFGKFLLLLIPKIITFFIIYYFLYYKIEDFAFTFSARATFKYIIIHIFKQNINCSRIFSLFPDIFTNEIEDVNHCYEFTYFFINMFLCIMIYLVISYLFLVIRNKFFEIAIILIGLGQFLGSIFEINDKLAIFNSPSNVFLKQYHIIGQTYSQKAFISFIGFYHLGFILGFLMFNSDNLKAKINRLLYESNGIHLTKLNLKINSESNSFSLKEPLTDQKDSDSNSEKREESLGTISSDDRSENSPNYYKNFILPYYPLKYFNKFIYKVSKLRLYVKVLLIILAIILIIIIDFILLWYVKSTSFQTELNNFNVFIFKSEKHICLLLFCFITILLITIPKKGAFRSFISSKIFVSTSRIGFIVLCVSNALTYFSFLIFSIRVKLYVPTFIIISVGNFLIFYILCFVSDTLTELPLRIIIKKLMRMDKKRESIIL